MENYLSLLRSLRASAFAWMGRDRAKPAEARDRQRQSASPTATADQPSRDKEQRASEPHFRELEPDC